MAEQRVSIYNRKGVLLDRLKATFRFSEALNDIGTAEFTMAISDPKCLARNLLFGNYLLLEHARLGKWAGVLAPHNGQDWNDDETITTRALSAEYQFWRRRAPLHDLDFDDIGAISGTEGVLLRRIISYANMEEDTLLRANKIYMGGAVHRMKLRYANLGDLVAHIVERSEMDLWCAPFLEDGNLRFYVNFMPRRGVDRRWVLRERIDMELPSGQHHRRDGELVNDVLVLAEGGDAPLKAYGKKTSAASIGRYGLWQGVDSIETDNETVAQAKADTIIQEHGLPKEKDKVIAIESEESPSTFFYIGLGDQVRVRKDSVIFYGSGRPYVRQARITGREYDSDSKKCILTLDGEDD